MRPARLLSHPVAPRPLDHRPHRCSLLQQSAEVSQSLLAERFELPRVQVADRPFQACQEPAPCRGDARRHDATVSRLSTAACQAAFLQSVEEARYVGVTYR